MADNRLSETRGKIFLFAAFALFLFCQREKTKERTEIIFGSYFRVKITGEKKIVDRALAEVFTKMREYNETFSIFSESSCVSLLNKSGRGKVSQDLLDLIRQAEMVSNLTNGLFDITIYPLMELWGFYDRRYRLPEREEIEKVKGLVSYKKIKIANDSVFLPEGTKIDLGGIAVGYAIDQAYQILTRWGIKEGLIDGGGDIRVFGEKEFKIGIKDPRGDKVIETVSLQNKSISTSGDYGNYFEVGGKRFSHILNPKTGYPNEKVMSVTVIGAEAVITDALATTLSLLGGEGREILKNFPGYRAILYWQEGEEIKRVEW